MWCAVRDSNNHFASLVLVYLRSLRSLGLAPGGVPLALHLYGAPPHGARIPQQSTYPKQLKSCLGYVVRREGFEPPTY